MIKIKFTLPIKPGKNILKNRFKQKNNNNNKQNAELYESKSQYNLNLPAMPLSNKNSKQLKDQIRTGSHAQVCMTTILLTAQYY